MASGMCVDSCISIKNFAGPIAQLIGTFVAAGLVIWQVGAQRRKDLLLQKENIRNEFKTKLHGEIEEKLAKLSDSSVTAGGIKYNLDSAFLLQQAALAQGMQPMPLRLEMGQFSDAYNKMTTDVIDVIKVIEKYEIIQPEIKIFQTAFSAALTDLRNAHTPLMHELLHVLPQRSPDGQNIIYKPIAAPDRVARIARLTSAYEEARGTIGCYLHDFRIEIQNLLLGNLFTHRVPIRQPLDPRHIVITTTPEAITRLQRYFEKETPWGRDKRAAEQHVTQELRQP